MHRRRFLHASLLAGLAACAGPVGPVTRAAPSPSAPKRSIEPPTLSSPPSSATATGEAVPSTGPSPDAPVEPEPTATDSPATAAALTVLCRDAWGAAPPADGFAAHTITRMTLHHSAVVLGDNRRAPSRLRQHQRHHQSQGWPDIAYHLGVDRRGNVYDLRPARFRGDTFTAYDPSGHFLLLAEGNFDQEHPTDDQLEAVARTFAWASGAFGVATSTLSGHRDHASTSCPGDALYAQLAPIQARATELASAGVQRQDLCGPQAAAHVAAIESGDA